MLQEDVQLLPELYGDIAEAYMEYRMFNEALDVLQSMAERPEVSPSVVRVQSH